jgi:hypothetical protein
MGYDDRVKEVEIWRAATNSSKKKWQFVMIEHSSGTIERIYRENVLDENFDN